MDVSRETQAKLDAYVTLLLKWNSKINLIGKSTIDDIWTRHIVDSEQVFDECLAGDNWADLGAGAGLPGLVVAILATERRESLFVTLVESDRRKSVFCRAAIRELRLNARVISKRIEDLEPLKADILSARALAPLGTLLGYAEKHMSSTGTALFLKGAGWKKEVDASLASWRYNVEKIPSKTEPSAVILKIGDIARV